MAVSQYSPVLKTDLGNVYGVLYLGILFSSTLYGITCIQTYIYFQSQYKDKLITKLLVLLLLLLDTAHQAFAIYTGYYYLVLEFGDVGASESIVWSNVISVILLMMIEALVQLFYAYRIYRFNSRKKTFVLIIIASLISEFATGLSVTIQPLVNPMLDSTPDKGFLSESLANAILTIITDMLITSSMCYLLHKSRTGLERSESLINKLIVYTVSTGVITSVDAILLLLIYPILRQDFYSIFFSILLPKLYCNSLLAALNIRRALQDDLSQNPMQSFPASVIRRIGALSPNRDEESTANVINVKIETDHNHFLRTENMTNSNSERVKDNRSDEAVTGVC